MFSFRTLFVVYLPLISLFACQQAEPTQKSPAPEQSLSAITIEAESFIESNGDAIKGDNAVKLKGEDAWLTFDVNVPTAGRYRCEIAASAVGETQPVFWMEDYIDNKDERTYNITGDMTGTLKREGSPLNKGLHKMKLHLKEGAASIDNITFTLMRARKATPITMTQKMEGSEWKLVWSDEFDTEQVDTTKWTYDIGDWGWGNNELQYYTANRPENARIEDGNLVIEARKNDNGSEWTSARLTTRGKVAFLYGRIEFRAKVPVEKGNWAAGWTLGDTYVDELSWPYCGEIDILETVGYELDNETGDGIAHASAHSGAYYFKLGNQPTGITDVKNMKEEFHTYGVDWSPEGITAYVDGKEYFEYSETSPELAWPFGQSQALILNLAMGGGWGGLQGMDETVSSQKFILDYVRVYERQ